MKKVFLMIGFLSFAVIFSSCDKIENQSKDALNMRGMELELNVDLRAKYSLSEEDLNKLTNDIVELIYTDANAEENGNVEKIESISIYRNDSSLILEINGYSVVNYDDSKAPKPCPSATTTCYSKSCVKNTLTDIIGDGSRDVIIVYDRGSLSVTITWAYQDC
tara:strand:- start:24238 stop:24726 length:489 start_codon:yes stop_codon:yes gene_type:complete